MAEQKNGTGAAPSSFVVPQVSLPKGGGAIRGIGEKFAANPVTGAGSMSVPIATSPSRSGFGPQLAVSYDSGSGNGPFGFGWSLSLPAITRKTDKGLPQYRDAEESDVFILSGAEDLVPVLRQDASGKWVLDAEGKPVIHEDDREVHGVSYKVRRYRPRVEGLFARVERWTNVSTSEIHWRSISRDNVTTLYGKDSNSRISDPVGAAPSATPRVFSWLICQSYDDKGNAITYEYAAENDDNVDRSQANEQNRVHSANRYLKRIKYGNRRPNRDVGTGQIIDPAQLPQNTWMFEVVLDYVEGHYEDVGLDPRRPAAEQQRFVRASALPEFPWDAQQRGWPVRPDPFSSYRAGFEVRTNRRCRRVLMFHHIPDLPTGQRGYEGLVRSTEFDYADLDYDGHPSTIEDELIHQGSTRFASFIRAVTQSGYVRDDSQAVAVRNGVEYATYLKKSLPPLEFEYSKAVIQDRVLELDAVSLENLPAAFDGSTSQWVDLDGEGVSGVLTEQAGAWFYKPNLGDGRFGPLQTIAATPSLTALTSGRQQLLDLAGDGQLDLVVFADPIPGFYERTLEGEWTPFRTFRQLPNVPWHDPNLRFIDLDGDGHADVLMTEEDAFVWHASLAEEGFGPARRVRQPLDEEWRPRLVLMDGTQSIYLADMSGDGLTDLVRIRNGEVCYWPNLGYGHFGSKVTMDNAPWFDKPDHFDQHRVRLADIDGSGTNDIIYLDRDGVSLYFNQSGNRLSDAHRLAGFPRVDNVSSVVTTDLMGNGTACLVWASRLPGDMRRPLRYVDLMGRTKPHLLTKTLNNLGAETEIQYQPSTRFYLEDKRNGHPWISRLPFPVHVVERVLTYDRISGNRFVTRYAYHHGFFDGVEREFRGFGLIEQLDTETFAALETGIEATNLDERSHLPPVLTKTWFHTGVYVDRRHVSDYFAGLLDERDTGEYYREPGRTDAQARELLLDDTVLPDGLTVDEEREACRALKGAMLRQEVYALDGTAREPHPYALTEQNFTIHLLQPQVGNRHAVFLTHSRETLNYHYERNPADPRVTHELILEADAFGNLLKSAQVAYGRRRPDPSLRADDRRTQGGIPIIWAEHAYTNAIDAADDFRAPQGCETRSYELTGLASAIAGDRFGFEQILEAGASAATLSYEESPTPGRLEKRLLEHSRTYFRRDDLSGALSLGQLQSLAVPFESYLLAFTRGLVTQVYEGRATDAHFQNEGGYVHSEDDDNWWAPSGQIFFSPGAADPPATELAHARQHFFMPVRYRDPFHTSAVSTETTLTYDCADLLLVATRDPLGNVVTASGDYRVLAPGVLTDANGNRSAAAFDALGMVVGTAVMGKTTETRGDSLAGFVTDLDEATLLAHLQDPLVNPHVLLARATTRNVYDPFAYYRTRNDSAPQPPVAYSLAREMHDADLGPAELTKIQHQFSYSDGFGREIQKKIRAPLQRWSGSGWTIFDNKGNPVRRYEPFFTATHRFERDVQAGVSSVLFYDPVGRVVATLHPDHAWEKVVFDAWRQESWDVNDTVLLDPSTDANVGAYFQKLPSAQYLPTWHAQRAGGGLGPQEQDASHKAAFHATTPSITHADPLGRAFLTLAQNRFARNATTVEETYAIRLLFDIHGNPLQISDAQDRVVVRRRYDMPGTSVRQKSMEAGERWTLNDVAGKPIRLWDSRNHEFRTAYDPLRRARDSLVREGSGSEVLVSRTDYGEGQPNPETKNQRGRVVGRFDQGGLVKSDDYDFKGNLLASRRWLASEYESTLDWLTSPGLEPEVFTCASVYDALNRVVAATAPDGSVYRPTFNETGLIDQVQVTLPGAQTSAVFVAHIDYDAKGQRVLIEYGNGARTAYGYDPFTLRLRSLQTTRSADPKRLQDLEYTYDPSGNITHIRDGAQQTIYFANQVVTPECDYTYDATYRLIASNGREHIGQAAQPQTTWDDRARRNLPQPGDGVAMRRYCERYAYDSAGNIQQLIHEASSGNWTRAYAFGEPSLIEAGKNSNRLSSAAVGQAVERCSYDAHGNTVAMSHLTLMEWDYRDQLHATARQSVTSGEPESTFYAYDAGGHRIRKVTQRQNGTRVSERIYLGGFEVYREYAADGTAVSLERQTLHVVDDQHPVALVERRTRGNDAAPAEAVRYQYTNLLGSATLELDDEANVVSYEEYYPYGGTSYQAGRSVAEVSLKRYRYSGFEREEETGFTYHGARYLAPWLGRWTSCDPLGIAGGLNLFEYANDSPVVFIDLTGGNPEHCQFPVNDEYKNKIGAFHCMPAPRPQGKKGAGSGTQGKKSTGSGTQRGGTGAKKADPLDPGGTPSGKPGGRQGGTATKTATSNVTEQGAGDGRGGLGEPTDIGTGTGVDPGITPTGPEGKPGPENRTGGKQKGGTQEGKKEGSKEGKAGGEEGQKKGRDTDILDALSELSSFIADPESLYEAQQSKNKGRGSQLGREDGWVKGWFAQILTVIAVLGSLIARAAKAVWSGLKKAFNSLRNKLLRSGEKKLLTSALDKKALQGVFGQGADEAEAILERLQGGGKIARPENLTREMLQEYRNMADKKIAELAPQNKGGLMDDAIATQSMRMQIIDILLGDASFWK